MWKVVLALVLVAAPVAFALFSLGFITIAGTGTPRVRYQVEQASAQPSALVWSFEDLAAGSHPAGSELLSDTRFGGWAVRREPDAPSPDNALCQTGLAEFPAIALGDAVLRDLVMSARFKPISGRVDQAAGLIFRVQDSSNYYVLRANALERNVNFYKYAGGRRGTLAEGPVEVRSGEWQDLRVEVTGDRFRGFLNGQPVAEATDDAFRAGRVGLWTKADSVTCFDDVRLSAR